jgi:hypothetical protein
MIGIIGTGSSDRGTKYGVDGSAHYTAMLPRKGEPTSQLSADTMDVIARRTAPFLDSIGVGKPLTYLLQEAYLQGVRDTVDCMEARNES